MHYNRTITNASNAANPVCDPTRRHTALGMSVPEEWRQRHCELIITNSLITVVFNKRTMTWMYPCCHLGPGDPFSSRLSPVAFALATKQFVAFKKYPQLQSPDERC